MLRMADRSRDVHRYVILAITSGLIGLTLAIPLNTEDPTQPNFNGR